MGISDNYKLFLVAVFIFLDTKNMWKMLNIYFFVHNRQKWHKNNDLATLCATIGKPDTWKLFPLTVFSSSITKT